DSPRSEAASAIRTCGCASAALPRALIARAAVPAVCPLVATDRVSPIRRNRAARCAVTDRRIIERAAPRCRRASLRERTFPPNQRQAIMYKILQVKFNERVVLFRDHLPLRAYGPGRHWLWGRNYSEQRWNTDELTFQARPGVRELL